jgi:2',3'-cyclic-nucleotide 2'-phosphodiesterase (5'-nucleotidase family)
VKKIYSLFLSVVLLSSCQHYYVAQYKANEIKITDSLQANTPHMEAYIKPYRDSLAKEMNTVIAQNQHTLSKHAGESELGNVLADAMLKKAQQYSGKHVDFAMINLGGIRQPQLPAGNVTLGNIFELMPFDNMIVLLELDGKTTKQFLDIMAASGGLPISGVRYTINNETATAITFNGVPFDENKTYTLGISDYLANGGDKLDLLKKFKQQSTAKLIRDAFIEYFSEEKIINGKLDGRIVKR